MCFHARVLPGIWFSLRIRYGVRYVIDLITHDYGKDREKSYLQTIFSFCVVIRDTVQLYSIASRQEKGCAAREQMAVKIITCQFMLAYNHDSSQQHSATMGNLSRIIKGIF